MNSVGRMDRSIQQPPGSSTAPLPLMHAAKGKANSCWEASWIFACQKASNFMWRSRRNPWQACGEMECTCATCWLLVNWGGCNWESVLGRGRVLGIIGWNPSVLQVQLVPCWLPPIFLSEIGVYSINSSETIGKFPAVSNFNRLFLIPRSAGSFATHCRFSPIIAENSFIKGRCTPWTMMSDHGRWPLFHGPAWWSNIHAWSNFENHNLESLWAKENDHALKSDCVD